LGTRVGKDRTNVNNYLRLLKLPPDIQIALRDQKISMGHARALITLKATDAQIDILQEAMQHDLSVRKVEELARGYMVSKRPKTPKQAQSKDHLLEAEAILAKLRAHLHTPVKIQVHHSGKGEVRIAFADQKDLDRLLKILAV
jgi:ParB family transcriptional regulator, chromosome partitioning protein